MGALSVAAGVMSLASSVGPAAAVSTGTIGVCSPSTGTCSAASTSGTTSVGAGEPGSIVKVTAQGLKSSPARYALYFAPAGGDCQSATKILKNRSGTVLDAMTTDEQGNLDRDLSRAGTQPYKAVIPARAQPGDAAICARETAPTAEDTSTPTATFTVTDGPLPTLAISDAPIETEGDGGTSLIAFHVTLSAATGVDVTVSYQTVDGTATAPSDYNSTAGIVTIPAGTTSGRVVVGFHGDTIREPDETYLVKLSSPRNAVIADAEGLGTIVNDD